MKKFYVYIHVCPNGKRYVGCTTRVKPELRWKEGNGYQYNKHFYSAILKYGWDNITHEVFEVESKEEMYRKEIELISFYHTNDPEYGYNNSVGGEKGASGCKHSEEFRKHRSESLKKKWADPEFRRKQSEIQKKVHSDPEYLRKQSEAQKKKWADPAHLKKQAEAQKKKWADPEFREKVVEALKKVHSDPEYRKKQSEAHKGKPHNFSEEARKHISETHKGKPKPKVKISLPDGTIIEMSKQNLTRHYINKGKEFQYVS